MAIMELFRIGINYQKNYQNIFTNIVLQTGSSLPSFDNHSKIKLVYELLLLLFLQHKTYANEKNIHNSKHRLFFYKYCFCPASKRNVTIF